MNDISVYIHIPFCTHICTYCDFPKLFYNDNYVNRYLSSLEYEIKKNYKGEVIKTIYVGGGTPSSLNYNQIKRLLEILTIFKYQNIEYTFECNIENIDELKLQLLKEYGINRISIGVQTLNEKYINFLGRHHNKNQVFKTIELVHKYFDNINVDLMYAFPGQTLEELESDINDYLKLNIPHISTYSLIIEPHTVIYNNGIKNISEDLDAAMYELIESKLSSYNHYEISNFGLKGYESKHNLVYWNNNHYYGYGLGASGYIKNNRYTNTRNMDDYLNHKYILDSHNLDINETIENEFILGLRKLEGINKKLFYSKYHININDISIVKELIESNQLIDNGKNIFINPKMIYISNTILVDFIGENYG